MRKRLVGVRHAMRIFLLLHRVTAIVGRVEQLGSQTIRHRFLAPATCKLYDPANRQSAPTFLMNFNRNLVSGSSYATRFNFDRWPNVFDCSLENLQGLLAGLLTNLNEGGVKGALCQ